MASLKYNRIPASTYRIQLNAGFTFQDAAKIVEYLRELGISDLYASPIFPAAPGSTHGYDVCGHSETNPVLGSFGNLAEALRRNSFGLLVDVVPNHMGASLANNEWWRDILELGRESKYATFFDVNWDVPDPALRGKVLLPILGDRYNEVVDRGELRLSSQNGKYSISYFDKNLPLSPETAAELAARTDEHGVEQVLREHNGEPGRPETFRRLHALIARQHYRLAWWRVGPEELNYRRFFDITDLVSLRIEEPEVFRATHEFIFGLIHEGIVTGLRIDHPDGLWDPKTYAERLQTEFRKRAGDDSRLYVVVEKILSGEELLPEDWPVAGTTGYEFLKYLNGLFVASGNAVHFTQIYKEFTGGEQDYEGLVFDGKLQVLQNSLLAETHALALLCREIAHQVPEGQDFTLTELKSSLARMIAAFPVYRTYVNENTERISDVEAKWIRHTAERAKRAPGDSKAVEFLANLLSLTFPAGADAGLRAQIRKFVMRFQQLSGPAMAKGLEDTTFYRYFRLISLNEVGGDPGEFGVSTAQFHQHNATIQQRWPHSLLATATHDTKRGEDVRARINVLSEIPEKWSAAVKRWSGMVRRTSGISKNDEYLFYQTLVGSWQHAYGTPEGLPDYRERVAAYILKAARESKLNTSWTDPSPDYEAALNEFVGTALGGAGSDFIIDLNAFVSQIAYFGALNSLAQVILKVTSPGVPDFYQGTELWDFNLVDPDNRRPVDFEHRRMLLAGLKESLSGGKGTLIEEMLGRFETGEAKLLVTLLTLRLRNEKRDLFERGSYMPLAAEGPVSSHVIAFNRSLGCDDVIVIVPRLMRSLVDGQTKRPMPPEHWKETALPFERGGRFRNVLTGEEVASSGSPARFVLTDVFRMVPFAVLERMA